MTKQFMLPGFLPGVVAGLLIAGIGFSVISMHGAQAPTQPAAGGAAGGRGQRGPAAPPAPCGPNIAGSLGKNTAPDSRCFEIRMYTVDPTRDGVGQFKGGIDDLHKRFREGELAVFKKSGVDVMAVWQDLGDPNTLIYLLSYKDRAAREAGWAKFNADPDWTALRTKYFVPLTNKIFFMSATDYSPLK